MYVEESLKDQVDTTETGEQMDAEKEHLDLCCEEEGIEDDPQYYHLNPQDLLEQNCSSSFGPKLCKKLQLEDYQVLEEKTQQLDDCQTKVLDMAVQFARDTVKSSKPPNVAPNGPKFVVTGVLVTKVKPKSRV